MRAEFLVLTPTCSFVHFSRKTKGRATEKEIAYICYEQRHQIGQS